jgi:hypothetical protein
MDHGWRSFSTFAFTAVSILMSGGQPRKLSGLAGRFLRRINAEVAAASQLMVHGRELIA